MTPPRSFEKLIYLAESQLPSQSANSVHVMRMSGAFARQEMDVTLCAMAGDRTLGDVHAFYNLPTNFHVAVSQVEDVALNRLLLWLRRNIPLVRVGMIPNFLLGRHIARRLPVNDKTVLFGRNLAWISAAVSRHPKVCFAFETHQAPKNKLEYHFLRFLAGRPGFRFCVVISDRLKQLVLEACPFFSADQIKVWHDGADEPAPTVPSLSGDRFKVGYVGHLYKGRGLQEIVLPIAAQLPTIEFHVVGGADEDVAALRDVSPPENVILHGFKRQSELPGLLASFDTVLAPYQRVTTVRNMGNTADYMSPLKVFEYMAAGKAMIASDLPVLHEVLTDGRNGLLADPDQPEKWVEAILRLKANPKERHEIEAAALQDIRMVYSWECRAKAILAAFDASDASRGGQP